MNNQSYQKQYADILRKLIYKPNKVGKSRVGNVHSNFVETIRVDLTKEFPLMDIKKVSFNNILHELLWFIKGNTNIKYLVDNKCNIWNDDAYRYYKEKYSPFRVSREKGGQLKLDIDREINKEEFIQKVKDGETFINDFTRVDENGKPFYPDEFAWLDTRYTYGDLDKVYGRQWRNFNGKTDQLGNVIETLKNNPDDRRMIVTAHNPTDLENGDVGLPSCHNYMQFYTQELTQEDKEGYAEMYRGIQYVPDRFISVYYNIRSNDFFLGQPYNTPSYALLLMMIGGMVGMIPKEVVCNAVDCHLYEPHLDAAKTWLSRYDELEVNGDTYCKANVGVALSDLYTVKSIDDYKFEFFYLENYIPDSPIKAPLLT